MDDASIGQGVEGEVLPPARTGKPWLFKPGNGLGRPKGMKNKVTQEVRQLALDFAPRAFAELKRIAEKGKHEEARIAAIKEILDRAYGKVSQNLNLKTAGPVLLYLNLDDENL